METRPAETALRAAEPVVAPIVADVLAPDGDLLAGSAEEARRLLQAPDAVALGRLADSPADIAWPGWRSVLKRVLLKLLNDRVGLVAAGCAFYATLALFPGLSMLVSIYGMLFDPVTVVPQLLVLQDLLPASSYDLISTRVSDLVAKGPGTLGAHLLFSTAVTLWSAASGTKSLMAALNLAYEERETRSFLRYQGVAFAITLCLISGTVVGLGLLVALPAALDLTGAIGHGRTMVRLASLVVLLAFVALGLSLLYRYAPNRRIPKWHWVTPGSLLATAIWLVASMLFSWYVGRFATYDATYGPLGTVVALMLWFYVTSYAVLVGAELNAELELQTVRDSTDGPPRPLGKRGAYVADHVAGG